MRTATIYNFLIEANIMASAAIILMLIVRRFLRKQLGNRAIFFAWLLVALRLLCPLALPNPLINEIRPTLSQDEGIRPIADQVRVRLRDVTGDMFYSAYSTAGDDAVTTQALRTTRDAMENGKAGAVGLTVYLIGVCVTAAYFVFANVRFRRRLKADRIEGISGKLLDEYNALCAARGVKPIPVYFVDPLPSACLVGVFKPYIALPLTAAPQDAIKVLTHEICHYKGKDHMLGVIRLLCCAVHWFNPLVWLAADMSRTDGELACDDRVIEKLNSQDKLAYANVLVLAAAKRSAPGMAVLATGMTMTGKKLKTRVSAIMHREQFRKGLALSFVVLASMLLVCAFATAEYKQPFSIPTPAAMQPLPKQAIATEDEAVAAAERLIALNAIGLYGEVTEIKVDSHGNGIWSLLAYSQDWTPPTQIILTDGGEVLRFEHMASGFDYAVATDAMLRDNPSLDAQAIEYIRAFLDTVDGGGGDIEWLCTGEGKRGASRFLSYQGMTDAEDHFCFLTLEVVPKQRVVFYYASEKHKDTASPVHASAGYDLTLNGFAAKDRSSEYASYSQPTDGDMTLEEAFAAALNAAKQAFKETDESLKRFNVEYGFVNHEYAYFTAPYWEFTFLNVPSAGEDFIEVIVHSPDGEILSVINGHG